jgi:hypothetical protein
MAHGDWEGSKIHDGHIQFLRETRRLSDEALVKARVPNATEITLVSVLSSTNTSSTASGSLQALSSAIFLTSIICSRTTLPPTPSYSSPPS